MRTRERGVAHVNIFFFLLVLVLFLGGLFFGYVQMDKNTDLENRMASVRAENTELKKERILRDQYIESIKAIGETGEFAGKVGFSWDDLNGPPAPLQNVPTAEKLKELAQGFARDAGIPESTAMPLSSLLSQAKQSIDTKIKEAADLQALRDKLATEKAQAEQARDEGIATASAENVKLNQQVADARQLIDAQVNKWQATVAGLRDQVAKGREESTSLREEHNKVLAEMAREANMLKARVDNMRQTDALVNPPAAPDGRIISSSQSVGRAWIDLGRKQMLPRGTVFRITAPGKTEVKAYGTVTKVESDRAEVQISGLKDRFDPVSSGDLISNEVYSPGVRRNVFLLGSFSAPNKPEIKRVLESLGNTVHDELVPAVDLVLVGGSVLNEARDGFVSVQDTDEYKKALSLNMEISSIHKVREFLKLGD